MAYKVILSDPAVVEVEEVVEFICADSREKARLWLSDFWWSVDTLKELPLRQPLIPEAESMGIPYRSFPLYSHRVIYRVDEEQGIVYIVRVYHSARRPLKPDDV